MFVTIDVSFSVYIHNWKIFCSMYIVLFYTLFHWNYFYKEWKLDLILRIIRFRNLCTDEIFQIYQYCLLPVTLDWIFLSFKIITRSTRFKFRMILTAFLSIFDGIIPRIFSLRMYAMNYQSLRGSLHRIFHKYN